MADYSMLWLQAAACGGDSMSLLGLENPNLVELLANQQITLLWHPSLSPERPGQLRTIIDSVLADDQHLDLLCIEGAIANGPEGTGRADLLGSRPKRAVIGELCARADFVLAMGTCASYGGIPAAPPNPMDVTGLQWRNKEPGGLLDPEWLSRGGLPVINVAGCPAHPLNMVQSMINLLVQGAEMVLDEWNRPQDSYNTMVHQGCTRNEYHEYDMEETDFGGRGCLFFNLGCQGPKTIGSCNSSLWNNQKSKPRAGVPCFGCTSPSFPGNKDFFKTDKIGDVPVELPTGVGRPNYMAYKGLAKAAAPQRLKDRTTGL